MALHNTSNAYGAVSRGFHWLTALLILTALPLGVVASNAPVITDADIARIVFLFSLHKTLGISIFCVALARIFWTATQVKPAPVHPGRRIETYVAETVHWLFYGALVIVPLSGWLHHAATIGLAPIWWPLGQSLPFVPKSPELAAFFAAWHWLFTKLLVLAILLHIVGAIKHVAIDRDGILARMVSGQGTEASSSKSTRRPALTAMVIWVIAMGIGVQLGLNAYRSSPDQSVAFPEWTIQDGRITLTATQDDKAETGEFMGWTATLAFDPDRVGQLVGALNITIATPSFFPNAETPSALRPDFLDSANFPIVTISLSLERSPTDPEMVTGEGTFDLNGTRQAVTIPLRPTKNGKDLHLRGQHVFVMQDFGLLPDETDAERLSPEILLELELEAVLAK